VPDWSVVVVGASASSVSAVSSPYWQPDMMMSRIIKIVRLSGAVRVIVITDVRVSISGIQRQSPNLFGLKFFRGEIIERTRPLIPILSRYR
jgi:hypothetical protein